MDKSNENQQNFDSIDEILIKKQKENHQKNVVNGCVLEIE